MIKAGDKVIYTDDDGEERAAIVLGAVLAGVYISVGYLIKMVQAEELRPNEAV